jgi:hypothetical protein
VCNARNYRGIPPFRKRDLWTAEEVAQLGTASDAEIGRRLGKSKNQVNHARTKRGIPGFREKKIFTPEQIARLGQKPDGKLAAEWGRTTASVVAVRALMGIAAFQTQKHWTPEELALLGTMSDAKLAKRVGRSPEAVKAARYARGIRRTGSAPHPHLDDIKREYLTTNHTAKEIASKYGVKPGFVSRRASERGWVRPLGAPL